MAGNLDGKKERMFADMLVVDSVRGVDSVGVAAVNAQGILTVHKKAMFPHDYLQTPGYRTIMNKVNRVLIGHNRWATKGGVNNITAHPFEFENVVGAHNGTLRAQHLLPDSNNFAIDSENIFHSIDIQGVAATYEKISGAAALVFFNRKNISINFLRNDERPFFYTFSKDRKSIFWASEDWMLTGLLAKHKIEHTPLINTKINHHYELPMEGFKANDELSKMRIKELTPYKAPVVKKSSGRAWGGSKGREIAGVRQPSKDNVVDLVKKNFPVGVSIKFHYLKGTVDRTSSYVDGWMATNSAVTVRVFINHCPEIFRKQLREGIKYDFIGRLNGYDKEGRMLVQFNSVTVLARPPIQQKKKDRQEELDSYIDFGGTMINQKEFDDLPPAARECCWCSSPIQFEEGNIMLDHRTTVCGGCAEIPDVKHYIYNIGDEY